jgi:hypothetical protein
MAKDYRSMLRLLLLRRQERENISWKEISEAINIQSSYLSRCLGKSGPHLGADLLFQIAKQLQTTPLERSILLLLRELGTTTDSDRRAEISEDIRELRSRSSLATAQSQSGASEREVRLMLNPIQILIHLALEIPRYSRDPKLLCEKLGLSALQLQKHLEDLQTDGWLKLSADRKRVVSLNSFNTHLPPSHLLTRAHQALTRQLFLSQCNKTQDSEKIQFIATFSGSAQTLEFVKANFSKFLAELKEKVGPEPSENLYQLSFDFIRWL